MADDQAQRGSLAAEPTPLSEIIGEGADAGPAAQSARAEQAPPSTAANEAVERVAPPPSSAPEPEDKPGMWAYAALKDERGKRQALAERNAELERALAAHQQQQAQSQSEMPDLFSDPQGYHQFVANSVRNELKTMEQNFSFRLAHDKHGDDFERAYGTMIHLAEAGDPRVVQWVMSTPDPGRAMMQWYEQALQQHQQQQRGGAVMPSNFSRARNVGSRSGPAWSGPTPLNDIFARERK
jgi:hypothetical protein